MIPAGGRSGPRMRIVVDGEVWVDGDLGKWQERGPEQFVNALRNPAAQKRGIRSLMMEMAAAVARGVPCSIELTTTDTSHTLTVTDIP